MQYLNACTKTLHIVAPVHQMFLLETLSGFAVNAFQNVSGRAVLFHQHQMNH